MAFVVEDGSIVALANALITEAFADTYHADRGNVSWAAASSPNKEKAIVRATDYTEQRWSARYQGTIVEEVQTLSWPRQCVYDKQGRAIADDVVPDKMKQAVAEYALRALTTTLFNEPTVDATGLRITGTRTKVGPIEKETRYAEQQSVVTLKPWPAADRLVAEFLSGGTTTVLRA